MAAYDVLVEVALRPGIADPQGATIERALPALGFTGISGVRSGKAFRFSVDAATPAAAQAAAEDLCRRFLTNPVIEDSVVTVAAGAGPS
ncbi:phosphoribosylformylglycinamidine synthase subunit PurS [Acidiferrimicrobium sp. IK]|uniref:phosphoribosylformylglycinamidine synthase subunit PurS n=1 Tax=Acidiferrimicrobium sp. IK TaxID=2871700 RepID=UPI0021CB1F50|nr:phosphoribosylformylglycinamidine synthase subunit PurS [Acidiferrimicrobium sp. IK]MCU4182962.1 phosphoribosylformylglycinamidine synthase subunit PurS [Acidiferrimicrobium sp. IK]